MLDTDLKNEVSEPGKDFGNEGEELADVGDHVDMFKVGIVSTANAVRTALAARVLVQSLQQLVPYKSLNFQMGRETRLERDEIQQSNKPLPRLITANILFRKEMRKGRHSPEAVGRFV